jgi:hypothetical protein
MRLFVVVFSIFSSGWVFCQCVNISYTEDINGVIYHWDDEGNQVPLTGTMCVPFTNDRMSYERELLNGVGHGVTRTWYYSGMPQSVWTLSNGELDGYTRDWNENGILVSEKYYIKGDLVYKKCWDNLGRLINCE